MKVLLAENDQALGLFLRQGLESEGHRVRWMTDAFEAVASLKEEPFDLAILDLANDGAAGSVGSVGSETASHGEQALNMLRAMDADLPLLVLTGRNEVESRVRYLDHGADDLVTKPFSLQELRARCRALLRRKRETKLTLRAGAVEIDRLEHHVRNAGQLVPLTNKEFALLEHLMLHRGQSVTRMELLESVWNVEPAQTTNIVDVYINYLRRKLMDPPPGHLIQTVRGRGYMIPLEADMMTTAGGIQVVQPVERQASIPPEAPYAQTS